jgi:hypothetical protein
LNTPTLGPATATWEVHLAGYARVTMDAITDGRHQLCGPDGSGWHLSGPTPDRELAVDTGGSSVLVRFFDSSGRHAARSLR